MTNNAGQVTQSEQDKKIATLNTNSPTAPISQITLERDVAPEDAAMTAPWTA